MSLLLLYVGENRYVIDNRYVRRVIPLVPLKKAPHTPPYVAGLLNISGHSIMTIDFCYLIEQRITKSSFSSRIILLENVEQKNSLLTVGLMAEKVIDIIDLDISNFHQAAFHPYASYLNGLYSDKQGIIQRVDVSQLFDYLYKNVSSNSYG